MKWFNNLKMIQKLLLDFITIGLFVGIGGGIGVANMSNIDKNVTTIYSGDLVIILIIIIGLLVAIALALIIVIGISKQIKKVVIVAEALLDNDLSKTIDIDNNSEIGSLAKIINKAIINIKTLIIEISESATDISATSEE